MGHHFREQESHAPVSRRVVLKGVFAGATIGISAVPALADMSVDACSIETLFSEWETIFRMDYSGMTGIECDAVYGRYSALVDRIISATARTEREFAIQYFVATDGGDSLVAYAFDEKLMALVGIPYGKGGGA